MKKSSELTSNYLTKKGALNQERYSRFDSLHPIIVTSASTIGRDAKDKRGLEDPFFALVAGPGFEPGTSRL
jgi:hypothetical protein